jgi:hypothetical protein
MCRGSKGPDIPSLFFSVALPGHGGVVWFVSLVELTGTRRAAGLLVQFEIAHHLLQVQCQAGQILASLGRLLRPAGRLFTSLAIWSKLWLICSEELACSVAAVAM